MKWLSLLHNFIQLSLNSGFAQVQTRSRRVGDSRWWWSLTMAPAGNKAKRLSSANHTTKTIHHHHQCWYVLTFFKKTSAFIFRRFFDLDCFYLCVCICHSDNGLYSALVCNPCPDLKFRCPNLKSLPQFIIFLKPRKSCSNFSFFPILVLEFEH